MIELFLSQPEGSKYRSCFMEAASFANILQM